MISAPGVGSGLDVNSIVQQLMTIERRPLDRLEADKRELQAQLSAFGKLKSAMTSFQSAISDLKSLSAFQVFKAESFNEDAFTATAGSGATTGFSSIQVVNLAEAHKMGSVSIADTDTTTLGGAGDQLTATVNGNAFSVAIGGMTLTEIRDAINSDPNNTGVAANIISENSGSHRLVLTSTDTGNANAMNLSFSGTVGTALGMTDSNNPANLDSEILIDGLYTVKRSGNTVDDAISGITLNLLGETTSADQLTVSRDTEKVKETVQGFVDAYNELKSTIDGLSGEGDDLASDNTLRGMENQIQKVFNTVPQGLTTSLTYLSEIGVSFDREGKLSLDADDLDNAIQSDFPGVAELFADDDQGYLFRLDAVLDGFVLTDGVIKSREDGINARISSTDDRIADMEYRLELREQRLRDQFSALDELMGQLNGTSQFLSQQLAVLPTLTLQRS